MTQTQTPKIETYARVVIVSADGYHDTFVGEEGYVWYSDRTGAVVALDSSGVPETRFVNAQLRKI